MPSQEGDDQRYVEQVVMLKVYLLSVIGYLVGVVDEAYGAEKTALCGLEKSLCSTVQSSLQEGSETSTLLFGATF